MSPDKERLALLPPSALAAARAICEGPWQGELNEAFDSFALRAWLHGIRDRLASSEAELIYRVRNRLYRVDAPAETDTGDLCVKAFAQPSLARSLGYALSSAGSKAARSFRYALHLHRQGVGVAPPIGYLERKSGRRPIESYFLSTYLPGMTSFNAEMGRLLREDPDCTRFVRLLRVVAEAVQAMHAAGFVHHDLGGQNILLRRRDDDDWDSPAFIDLNRGRILPEVSLRLRARDLAKLEIPSYLRIFFFQMYFGDEAIPREFARWEAFFRWRITVHNESRKYRHPIRHLVHRKRFIFTPADRPSYRDMWLWDRKSGQPSVMLTPWDRKKYFAKTDLWFVSYHNLRRLPAIARRYRQLRARAYQQAVAMERRIGLCVDVMDSGLDASLHQLEGLAGISLLVRCYFHRGEAGLELCSQAVARLAEAGHEVTVALVQSRQAALNPTAWTEFCRRALEAVHPYVRFVEVGHAVNRAKWGCWRLAEIEALYAEVDAWRARYPEITFLGPAVNDFEYHYYAPLLARMGRKIDGLSCHLYVDRRGAPESKQGPFSLLEKSTLARAIADVFGLTKGFYVTETNWPLTDVDEYSPVQSTYRLPNAANHPLAVDEETYAAYMVRYYLMALCSGSCERVWWWRLSARGFGLVDDVDGSRRRPAWHALVQLYKALGTATFSHREERDGAIWFHFDRCTVAYALTPVEVPPPAGRFHLRDLFGQSQGAVRSLTLGERPVYLSAGI